MEVESVERKWQMVRVKAGDYLLPSNDRTRLWRIYKYVDGPTYGLVDMKADREFWEAAVLLHPMEGRYLEPTQFKPEYLDEPDRWGSEAGHFDTRQEAIDYAMRQPEKD